MNLKTRVNTLKTILDPNRIIILMFMQKSESCVCEMVRELGIKHSLLSHHLSTLVDIGFLENKKNGRHSVYRIKDEKLACVNAICELLTENHPDCN